MSLLEQIVARAKANKQRIVLPEAEEERTLKAADRVLADDIADLILIGNPENIRKESERWGLQNIGKATIVDPLHFDKTEDYAQQLAELRKSKGMTLEQARELVTHNNLYLGCMIIRAGDADGQIVPSDRAGFFDHVAGGTAHDFRRRAIEVLEQMGISVEFSHHEGGPGQNEIDLRFADALSMADNIMTFRAVVEEIALEEGYIATFMPKPFKDQPGSGMHTHFSLFEGERNAFFDPAGEYQLSAVGRSFVAGLLRHASEITAVTNQHVNSYKRLWGEDEAPSYISWGQTNRSSLVRVPTHKPGKAQSARIEYRALDSAANPYLAFAVILAAGMKGIEEGYELPAEANNDVWALSEVERRALGIQALPTSLKSAVAQMANSDVVADTLGEDAFAFFMRDKESEWRAYDREITNFELNQFITQF